VNVGKGKTSDPVLLSPNPTLAKKKIPAKKKAKTTMKDDTSSKKEKVTPEMKKSKHSKTKKEVPKLANEKTPAEMMIKTKTKNVILDMPQKKKVLPEVKKTRLR